MTSPILILYFKMISELFFRRKYTEFFSQEDACTEALRRIFTFIQDLLDPNEMASNLVFWAKTVSFLHRHLIHLQNATNDGYG
jgi:hypothetical protein